MESETKKYRNRAEGLLGDQAKLEKLVDEGMIKAEQQKERLKGFFYDLKALFRLIRAYAKGDYRATPWKSLVAAVTAVVYFIYPLDFIPDFLLPGFLDDALVVGWVLSSIKKDLSIFLHWEQLKASHEI